LRIITRAELPSVVWRVGELVVGGRSPRDEVEEHFTKFHQKHPQIYAYFDKYAMQAVNAGKKKYSAWLIVNVIRWEVWIDAQDDNSIFKVCNDYIALYARLWMERNPQYHDYIITKLRAVELAVVAALGATVESRAE
jgi:hypothetical protein